MLKSICGVTKSWTHIKNVWHRFNATYITVKLLILAIVSNCSLWKQVNSLYGVYVIKHTHVSNSHTIDWLNKLGKSPK